MKQLIIFTLIGFIPTALAFGQKSKVGSAERFLKHDNLKKAKKAIDSASQHEETKNNPKTWLVKGKIYFKIGTNAQHQTLAEDPLLTAYDAFQKCIKIDKKKIYAPEAEKFLGLMPNSLHRQGLKAYKKKKFRKAYNHFKYAIDLKSGYDSSLTLAAAYTAEKSGNTKDAKKYYKMLVDHKYRHKTRVYRSLANIYQKQGKTDSALHVLTLARKRFPRNQSLIIDEVSLYLRMGRQGEIVPKLKEAISMDSDNPNLHFALGTAYETIAKDTTQDVKDKLHPKAISSYKKAINHKQNYFDARFNLGALYYNKGTTITNQMNNLNIDETDKYNKLKKERNQLFRKAKPHLEKALKLKPKDRSTLTALRTIYKALGNKEKAKEMKRRLESAK